MARRARRRSTRRRGSRRVRAGRARGKILLVSTASAAAVFLLAAQWLPLFAFDRTAVLGGQFWRLATCHLTHLDPQHALVNAVGCGLILAILRDSMSWKAITACAVILASATSLAGVLLWVRVDFAGFSGILYGLATVAVFALRKRSPWLAGLMAAVLVAGIVAGIAGYSRPWTADVAVHTHIVGMAVGAWLGNWIRRNPSIARA